MKNSISHKSEPPLREPFILATSSQNKAASWQCPDQGYGDFELKDLSRKGKEEPEREKQCRPNQNYEDLQMRRSDEEIQRRKRDAGKDANGEIEDTSKAFVKQNDTTANQLYRHRFPVDERHNLKTEGSMDRTRPLLHNHKTPRRRRRQLKTHGSPARDEKRRIAERVRQIRAETQAIREETRRFLEDSDDDEAEHRQEASIDRIERAEIRKIRAETRAIRDETDFIEAETQMLINSKRAPMERKIGHIRYSL